MKSKKSLKSISQYPQSTQKQGENENWSQLRLPSGSLNSRSYHTISYYFNRIYIYGGYELHSGVKDDFFYFNYSSESLGQPSKVQVKNPSLSPGPLCRHSANQYSDQLIIYGGRKNAMESSNSIYIYDFIEDTWQNVKLNIVKDSQEKAPYLESHSSCIDQSTQKMYVFGGFEGYNGHINTVYQFDIEQLTWKELPVLAIQPCKRSSHNAVIIKGFMYIFGGQNLKQRLGDFWQFNLSNNTWLEITQKNSPQPRNGHSMCVYKDNIIIFGGILGITREINDLFCYSEENKEWIRLEDETKYEISDVELLLPLTLDDSESNDQTSRNGHTSRNGQTSRNRQTSNNSQTSRNGLTSLCTTGKVQLKIKGLGEITNDILDELKSPLGYEKVKQSNTNSTQIDTQIFHNMMEEQIQNKSLFSMNSQNQSPTTQTNEQLMFEQYINGQRAIFQNKQRKGHSFFSEQNTPSLRMEKRKQIRNSYNSQYMFGSDALNISRISSNPYYRDQMNTLSASNENQQQIGGESKRSSRNISFLVQNKIFGADEMLESMSLKSGESSQLNHYGIKNSRSDIKGIQTQNCSINSSINYDISEHFQSFAVRAKKQSVNPLKQLPLKESINTLFDKIKRLSMNPLISKIEKYNQITELRKKILLREFVESETPHKSRQSIDRNSHQLSGYDSKMSSQKYISTDGNQQVHFHHEQKHNEDNKSRFPMLKSPTTDAMRKSIKATESKSKSGMNPVESQMLKLNTSQMLEQIKSVKIENCRIKNIKPQPRDGHSAIVIDDNLIILGGDRHKLSFNDMFECNLKKALENPIPQLSMSKSQINSSLYSSLVSPNSQNIGINNNNNNFNTIHS